MKLSDLAPNWQQLTAQTSAFSSAVQLIHELQKAGYQAFIVGGTVRDLLRGVAPKDVDIATNARPADIHNLHTVETATFRDTAQAYGITHVHVHGHLLEVATFRRDVGAHRGRKQTDVVYAKLEDDLARRDFTINALAWDPVNDTLLDYVDGVEDITLKRLRFIGEPLQRIQEDPLRVLRAIRFKNALGFTYGRYAASGIQESVERGAIDIIASDRMRQELTRMFIHPSRRQALEDLDRFGILERILPEVTAGKGVDQPKKYHAEGDVWQHTLHTFDCLPEDPSHRLAWAALLHDIGKPVTLEGAEETATFHDHYGVGADMAKNILKRLNFSTRDTTDITWMIHHHMNIDDLPNMRPSKQRQMLGHPAFADLFALHKADATASWSDHERHRAPTFPELEKLWHDYQNTPKQPSLKDDLGIDGHWLMESFAIPPGPHLRHILDELEAYYHDTKDTSMSSYIEKVHEITQKLSLH